MAKQSPALQQVLKVIHTLQPEEQLEVKKRVDFLLSSSPPHSSRSAVNDWLTEGIVTELIRRGQLHKGMDWKKVAPKGYQQSVDIVCDFLFDAVGRPLNTAEKYALGRVVARALADYLENTPGFGLKVMLQGVGKVAVALDASYPGYAASGMLGMLIKVK